MPYTQVDHDAIKRAHGMAPVMGIGLQQAVGGLTLMWAWCWSERRKFITGIQAEGFMGGGSRIVEAMVGFEFLRACDDGTFEVCGAEKFLRLRDAVDAGKRKGGLAAKNNLKNVGRSSADSRQVVGSNTALTPDTNTIHHTPAPVNRLSSPSAPVQSVFDHWVQARGKTKGMLLDQKRQKIIATALKSYSQEQLCKAIDGVALDPWPERVNQDGIGIILRPDNIDKFLALAERDGTDEYVTTYPPDYQPLQAVK